MAEVWVVDVRDDVDARSSRRLKFATREEAWAAYAAAVKSGFSASCEQVQSRREVRRAIATST
jgi:hypothetical protein